MTPEEKQRILEILNNSLSEHNRQIERLANEPEQRRKLGFPYSEEGLRYVEQLKQRYVNDARTTADEIEIVNKHY